MDSDLLTVARTLAERGWLPGIAYEDGEDEFGREYRCFVHGTEAIYVGDYAAKKRTLWNWLDTAACAKLSEIGATIPEDRTTLSLLRSLLAACEAAEAKR